jgi:hypothetical protein
MEITCVVRQTLLYGHIIAFALAIATVLKEDVCILRAKRIDPERLLATAKLVKCPSLPEVFQEQLKKLSTLCWRHRVLPMDRGL